MGEFPPNRGRADGLALYCRQCKREADRAGRRKGPPASADGEAWLGGAHPEGPPVGVARNPEPEPERARAPALAITDELVDAAAELIRSTGATRRAAARHVGVSENTFKGWLREGAEAKSPDDPRARLLFAIESAEGEAELELTRSYWFGAKNDPQVAQRFLERRFSKGDEKWARTEHLTVTDGDAAPMEALDARKLLADKLGKLLSVAAAGRPAGPPGPSPGAGPEGGPTGASPGAAADADGALPAPE